MNTRPQASGKGVWLLCYAWLDKKAPMAMASQVWAHEELEFELNQTSNWAETCETPAISEWNNSGALSPWRMDGDVHKGNTFWFYS
jgi:hypothetical protein